MANLAGATPISQITPEMEASYLKDLKQYCADSYTGCESAENVCMQYVNAIDDSIPNKSRRDMSSPLVARKFCPWCRKVFPKIIPVIVKLCEVGIICN